MIHIFMSERELDRYGRTKRTLPMENTWKSDFNFLIEDSGVEEGRDYHALTHQDRTLELDTIRAPPDEVVTGARFRVVNNRLIIFFIFTFLLLFFALLLLLFHILGCDLRFARLHSTMKLDI